MNYQNKQAHNLAKMQPASVFLQPVGVNLVSFAQQAREGNFFFLKKGFFFSWRKGINYLSNFFLFPQKSAQVQQFLLFP